MEEAYTVGIRLLLENGVSPGLAVIGRELDQADRAVAATQGGMERLRSVAAEAAAATRAVPQVALPAALPAMPAPATEHVKAAPRSDGVAPPPRGVATMRDGASVVNRSERVASPVAPVPARTAPVVRPVEAPASVGMPAKPVVALDVARAPAPARPVAVAPVQLRAPPVREVAEPVRAAGRTVDFAGFAPVAPSAVVAQVPVPVMRSGRLAAPPAAAGGAARHNLAWAPAMQKLAVAVPRLRQEAPRAAAAPVVATPPRPADPVPARTDAPEAGRTGGATGGDVFLDGMRVGRWMARELTRQAGGPATGATGFDPRASAVWPGALQGS